MEDRTLFEKAAYQSGCRLVVGVDEAGRGPLAGPVVAAACILARGLNIEGVHDSKKLTPIKREELYHVLTTHPDILFGIGIPVRILIRIISRHVTIISQIACVNIFTNLKIFYVVF